MTHMQINVIQKEVNVLVIMIAVKKMVLIAVTMACAKHVANKPKVATCLLVAVQLIQQDYTWSALQKHISVDHAS